MFLRRVLLTRNAVCSEMRPRSFAWPRDKWPRGNGCATGVDRDRAVGRKHHSRARLTEVLVVCSSIHSPGCEADLSPHIRKRVSEFRPW